MDWTSASFQSWQSGLTGHGCQLPKISGLYTLPQELTDRVSSRKIMYQEELFYEADAVCLSKLNKIIESLVKTFVYIVMYTITFCYS
jgi:hypothetical protein